MLPPERWSLVIWGLLQRSVTKGSTWGADPSTRIDAGQHCDHRGGHRYLVVFPAHLPPFPAHQAFTFWPLTTPAMAALHCWAQHMPALSQSGLQPHGHLATLWTQRHPLASGPRQVHPCSMRRLLSCSFSGHFLRDTSTPSLLDFLLGAGPISPTTLFIYLVCFLLCH